MKTSPTFPSCAKAIGSAVLVFGVAIELALQILASPAQAQIEKEWAMPSGHRYHSEDPYDNYKRARFTACKDEVLDPGIALKDPEHGDIPRPQRCYVSDNPVKYTPQGERYNPITHYYSDSTESTHPRGPDTPDYFPVNVLIVQHGYGGAGFYFCDDEDDFSTSNSPTSQPQRCDMNHLQHIRYPIGYGPNDAEYGRDLDSKGLFQHFHRSGAYNNWAYGACSPDGCTGGIGDLLSSDYDDENDDFANIHLIPYLERNIPGYPGIDELIGLLTGAYYRHHQDNESGFDPRKWVVLPLTMDINPGTVNLLPDKLPSPTEHNEHGLATTHNGWRLRLLVDNLWRAYKGWIDTISFVGHSTAGPIIKSVLQKRVPGKQKAYLKEHEWIRYTDDVIGLAPGYGGTPSPFCDPANDDLKVTLGGGIVSESDFHGWFGGDVLRYWTPSKALGGGKKRTAKWPDHLNVLTVAGVWRKPDGYYLPVVKCPWLANEDASSHNTANGDPLSGGVMARAPLNHHGNDVMADDEWWSLGKFDGAMGSRSTVEAVAYWNGTRWVSQVSDNATKTCTSSGRCITRLSPAPSIEHSASWVLSPGLEPVASPLQGDGYMSTDDLETINNRIPVISGIDSTGGRNVTYVEVDGTSHLGLLRNESVHYLIKRRLANATITPHFRTLPESRAYRYNWQRQGGPSGPWRFFQKEHGKLHGQDSANSLSSSYVEVLDLYPRGGVIKASLTYCARWVGFDLRTGRGRCIAHETVKRLVFPGLNDAYVYSTSRSAPRLWGGAEFTWFIRVNVKGSGNERRDALISHGGGNAGTGAYLKLSNGRLKFGTNDRFVMDGDPFPLHKWVSIVATKDRFGNLMLYRDGRLEAYRFGSGNIFCLEGQPCRGPAFPDSRWDVSIKPLDTERFYIGTMLNSFTNRLDYFLFGEVQEIEILSRALKYEEAIERSTGG